MFRQLPWQLDESLETTGKALTRTGVTFRRLERVGAHSEGAP